MKKIWNIITVLAALVTIGSSLVFLLTGSFLPGLTPLSLCVVLAAMDLSAREQLKQGKLSKAKAVTIVAIAEVAALINLIAAAVQLFVH